jgi:hypothetical protein
MRVFVWHWHGGWMTPFVQGAHEYYVPTLPNRSANGLGRAVNYEWPASVIEVSPEQTASLDVDVVVLQRVEELDHLAARWLGGRVPGRDIPAIYVEHNTPDGTVNEGMRHPLKDRQDVTIVHITHFNDLFWDCGTTPRRVIEHGIVDPGHLYTGELARAAVVINNAVARQRIAGADLLPYFGAAVPIDLFGINTEHTQMPGVVTGLGDQSHRVLHAEMARRRLYLHPNRWTSIGLSLLEAMHLGMPVVGLATTEVVRAVSPLAGLISTSLAELRDFACALARDPVLATELGLAARESALSAYGLERFLRDWDALLGEVTSGRPTR